METAIISLGEVMESIQQNLIELLIVAGLVTGLTNQFKKIIPEGYGFVSFFIALVLSFVLILLLNVGRDLGMNVYQVTLLAALVGGGATGIHAVTKQKSLPSNDQYESINTISNEKV